MHNGNYMIILLFHTCCTGISIESQIRRFRGLLRSLIDLLLIKPMIIAFMVVYVVAASGDVACNSELIMTRISALYLHCSSFIDLYTSSTRRTCEGIEWSGDTLYHKIHLFSKSKITSNYGTKPLPTTSLLFSHNFQYPVIAMQQVCL